MTNKIKNEEMNLLFHLNKPVNSMCILTIIGSCIEKYSRKNRETFNKRNFLKRKISHPDRYNWNIRTNPTDKNKLMIFIENDAHKNPIFNIYCGDINDKFDLWFNHCDDTCHSILIKPAQSGSKSHVAKKNKFLTDFFYLISKEIEVRDIGNHDSFKIINQFVAQGWP